MDVTLIVKASNQQCEDLTIKCEPSWTIRRLKGHLTEVYPGKPSSDEQKLIYSGQLLGDSVVLKDVLRKYDGQQAHTVHLVFTPKNSYYGSGGSGNSNSARKTSGMATNASSTGAGGSSGGSPGTGANTSNTSGGSSLEHNDSSDDDIGSDGLRRRTFLQTRPALRTLPGPPPFMEQTVALQSLMQQTYMQYLNQYINLINQQGGINALYSATGMPPADGAATSMNPLTGTPVVSSVPFVPMTQAAAVSSFPNLGYYQCMSAASHVGGLPSASSIPTSIASTAGPVSSAFLPSPSIPSTSGAGQQASPTSLLPGAATTPTSSSSSSTAAGASSSSGATATAQPVGAEPAAAAPAQGAPQDAAVGEAAAPARARRFPNIVVEEQENNDWLDVFFSMCRVGILMTVIYLYSSPMRCLTVLFIGVMLYLKKHLDRVYQAIDRRLTRLQAAQAVIAAQPQAAPAQPNNNVPDQQLLAQGQRPEPDVRDGVTVADDQPSAVAGSSSASDGTTRAERAEADAEAAGPSTSQSAPVPRPRTGPASRTAEANVAGNIAANAETEPLLERELPSGNDTNAAEQPAAEGQRMTFNDMTSFLGTLVITFFTSIIPDTPAA